MTGETIYRNIVQEFDRFFTIAYNKLIADAISICQHCDYFDDLVHDNYLKVRRRIWVSGFTGTNFHGFIWRAMQNDFKMQKNKKKNRPMLDVDDYEVMSDAELVLLDQQEYEDMVAEYFMRIEFTLYNLYKYIRLNYDDKAATLFEMYFEGACTYEELSAMTKYSLKYISNTIKPMKIDLRKNFPAFNKNQFEWYVEQLSNNSEEFIFRYN